MSTAAIAAPALSLAPASPAAAAAGSGLCAVAPALVYPNLNVGALQAEPSVNVIVGGDFEAKPGAAEAEGVVLVGGSAVFDTNDYYSLGVAGVGSRVAPPAGSDMLVAGGPVTVTSGTLGVGAVIGGNVVSASTVSASPPATSETSGGTITQNAVTPLAGYAGEVQDYRDLSTIYTAMAPNPGGSVVSTANEVTFTGDGSATRQVFSVAGTDLGTASASKTMYFDNIPAGTIVIVNVTGTTATIGANSFSINGTAVDPQSTTSTLFSDFTQSLLWNFPAATTVTLGNTDQLLGSILIPQVASTTVVNTSTNGRFFAAGNVVTGGTAGAGLEFHSYPFREIPCAASGSLAITKTLTDANSVVAAGRLFTGAYDCRDSLGAAVLSGTWSLAAGATFVSPAMAAGSRCTVTEDTPTAPSAADPSYLWRQVSISPASAVVSSTAPATITVHNEVRRALGGLEMVKVLDDPYDVVDLTRFYSGTFTCVFKDGSAPLTGTWREQAGSPPVLLASNIPIGTVCTLTEDPILVPPLPGFPQYHWATPVISPATVTVVENTIGRFTVTNIVVDPIDPTIPTTPTTPTTPGALATPAAPAALATTGASAYGPLAVGGVMILLGLIGLLIKRSQRRRADGR